MGWESEITKHGVEINHIKEDVKDLRKSSDALYEIASTNKQLATMMDMQRESLDEVRKQTKENSRVMHDMHINLTGLNHEMKELREDMNSVKGDVFKVNSRVDGIEKERTTRMKKKEDRRHSSIYKIITGVITTVLGTLILLWFGLQ